MRRVALFAVLLSLLGLTTAVAASFSVNAEDVASFTTPVSITPPVQAQVYYLKGAQGTLPGTLNPTLDANEPVRSKTITNDPALIGDQADPTKYHTWETAPAPAGGLVVGGNARLVITQNGGTNPITAGLFDCPNGVAAASTLAVGCVAIGGTGTNPGDEGGGYKERIATWTVPTTTVAEGRRLRLKVVNRSGAPWEIQWGYLPARQARLEIAS